MADSCPKLTILSLVRVELQLRLCPLGCSYRRRHISLHQLGSDVCGKSRQGEFELLDHANDTNAGLFELLDRRIVSLLRQIVVSS